MTATFYIAGAIAVVATARMLTRIDVVHALLYLVVSLLAVALILFTLGAPFVAALEVIVYAGAIMVLFVFVVMMLNLGVRAREAERALLAPRMWVGPSVLAAALLALLVHVLAARPPAARPAEIGPARVGAALFGPYVLGVELASLLLLAALVGAYHLGVRHRAPQAPAPPKGEREEIPHDIHGREPRARPGGDLVRAGARGAARPT